MNSTPAEDTIRWQQALVRLALIEDDYLAGRVDFLTYAEAKALQHLKPDGISAHQQRRVKLMDLLLPGKGAHEISAS